VADFGGFTSEFGPGTAPAPPPVPPQDLTMIPTPVGVFNNNGTASYYLYSQSNNGPVHGAFGMGQLAQYGWDGAAYGYGASIYFRATDNWTPTDHGAEVLFFTTPNGATAAAGNAGVTQGGALWCGGPGVLPTNATDGFFGTPAMAGAPTGVPVINYATAPMVFDTTDKVLWVYSGGWNPLTPLPTGAAGQVLTGQGAGNPAVFKAAASGTVRPANPAAPASGTSTMAGLGATCAFTPTRTGQVMVTISGHVTLAAGLTAGAGMFNTIYYGTGTPPANGAAVTGTQATGAQRCFVGVSPTAAEYRPFSLTAVLTGLVIGTPYWVDLVQSLQIAGQSVSTANLNFAFMEQ